MKNYNNSENMNVIDGERGAALVLSILAMLLISVLAVALISTGMVSGNISTNSRQQTEAFFIAETGLTHATNLIAQAPATNASYTSILIAGNGVPGTGDELSTRPTALTPISGPMPFGNGSYTVQVWNDPADGNPLIDTNKKLRVKSIGTGRDGSTATVEVILAVSTYPAILVNGNLRINGNPTISGSEGNIHANGTVQVSGNPCVRDYVSSTSTVTVGGSIQGGAGCSGTGTESENQPIIELPSWDIHNDFFNRADYILGADGRVTNPAGTTVYHNSATGGNDWYMPNASGGKWTWKGTTLKTWEHGGSGMEANKTYYAVGNMTIPDSFGTVALPVVATFIAEGFINVSGNPIVRAKLDGKFAFMAGTDLAIGGDPASGDSSSGIHYANDQIKFNGNPRITGVILARNNSDNPSPVACGSSCNPVERLSGNLMELSGNARVTYDGDLTDNKPRLLSWREVRN